MRFFPTLALVLLTAAAARAENPPLEINSLFSDHAVVQRDRPLPVFGTAPGGTLLKVKFADRTLDVAAASDGTWKVEFPALPAGGPHTLTVEGGGQRLIKNDLVVGDVWLMAGQSNMEVQMEYYGSPEEIAAADFPNLRMYAVPTRGDVKETGDAKSQWQVAEPNKINRWSAIAYQVGRQLLTDTSVPQGVVVCARGNTSIASWMHADDVAADAELKPKLEEFNAKLDAYRPDARKNFAALHKQSDDEYNKSRALVKEGKTYTPSLPPELFSKKAITVNYYGMLSAVRGFTFRGVVWYQGESDAGRGDWYSERLTAFFNRLRANQQEPDLPIVIVQLPRYQLAKDGGTFYAPLRDEQRQFVVATPGAQLVSTIDLGEAGQIHPKPKNAFSERITKALMAIAYQGAMPAVGPYPAEAKAVSGGVSIIFRETGDKLLPEGQPIPGFEVSADGTTFTPAKAVVLGKTVKVEAAGPVQLVRYLWQDVPETSDLKNSAGLPAGSFLLTVAK